MRRLTFILAAGLTLAAAPAAAQTWGGTYDQRYQTYDSGHGGFRSYDRRHDYRGSNAVPSAFDWRSQLDRPGDYRCDAFWDANRSDCGDRWRDQRHRVSPQARRDYRGLAGYSHGSGQRRYDSYGYGYGHSGYERSYSTRGYGGAWDHARGSTTWHGAYGRPDHVYPSGGVSYGGYTGYNSGYSSRSDWCRANYRSYDPRTGYYRAYSGRLVYCG
jgi:hypothetical protein